MAAQTGLIENTLNYNHGRKYNSIILRIDAPAIIK